MIPPFEEGGALPTGRYLASPEDVRERFVIPFPESNTRRPRYNEWRRRRSEIARYLAIEMEWLGGSYLTTKTNPEDIDVATFYDGDAFDALAVMERARVDRLIKGDDFEPAYGCDGFPVAIRSEGHPQHDLYLQLRGFMDMHWCRERTTRQPKGYLEVRGDP